MSGSILYFHHIISLIQFGSIHLKLKKSYDDLMANKCNVCPGEMNTVGYYSTKVSDEPVTYYMKTTATKPFCINSGTPLGWFWRNNSVKWWKFENKKMRFRKKQNLIWNRIHRGDDWASYVIYNTFLCVFIKRSIKL